ncbi:HNH endonuclease family protein [Nocardia salmonicida]|uniref:HNH endonuclease family protein n=1 Tax=Nocardia salmonicida TaxID=53431 RepID=UPI0035A248FD
MAFTGEEPSQVQIDHVFPLARAWKAGASRWTTSQRVRFANDIDLNLLAVAGIANQSKSDQGLDTWVPKNASFACEYVRRYLSVAQRYQLMVTRAEVATALVGCP